MLARLRSFMRLSGKEKRLFLEAFFRLGMMRAALLVFSFKRLTRSLKQQQGTTCPPPLRAEDVEPVLYVGKAISRAALHTPWESACLVQVLAARGMLQARGIPGVFYLGVMKDGDASGQKKMQAHAWTQCGDMIITGGEGHEAFSVISVFAWSDE